ncbi:MAG TPA: glycosyltransferase family A protein [Longimicrobium sp.]
MTEPGLPFRTNAAATPPPFTVTVIIPTRDRDEDLHRCLESIRASCRTCAVEVIVVDDGSRVPVRPRVVFPEPLRLRVMRNETPVGSAASRNAAAAVAEGEALAFLDDDAVIPEHWFRVVQRELHPERGAITGPVQGFDRCVVARARQIRYDERYHDLDTGADINFLAGGNSVVWADAFRRAGGFPVLPTASDNAFLRALRGLGVRCYFVRDLTIGHRNSKGLVSAVTCAFQAGLVSGALPAPRRQAPRPSAPRRGEPAARALNRFLNLCFKLGRAASGVTRRRTPASPILQENSA